MKATITDSDIRILKTITQDAKTFRDADICTESIYQLDPVILTMYNQLSRNKRLVVKCKTDKSYFVCDSLWDNNLVHQEDGYLHATRLEALKGFSDSKNLVVFEYSGVYYNIIRSKDQSEVGTQIITNSTSVENKIEMSSNAEWLVENVTKNIQESHNMLAMYNGINPDKFDTESLRDIKLPDYEQTFNTMRDLIINGEVLPTQKTSMFDI